MLYVTFYIIFRLEIPRRREGGRLVGRGKRAMVGRNLVSCPPRTGMTTVARRIVPWIFVGLLFGAAGWALSQGTLPPADFTFCNGTELKTIDPATVTGIPEGRVI